jgi:hypothetical protein
MKLIPASALALVLCGLSAIALQAQTAALDKPIPKGARVYIAPVEGGFENFLAAGISKKQVPIVVVASREKADFEISGISESEKAGWAKMLLFGSQQSREEAGIKVLNLKTDEVVFAYAVNKGNSFRGKQSAAEACAKHLKEKVEGAGK